jgi:hypothetical protein
MLRDYIETALRKAHYEIIDDETPFYGEIPELQGVWASGKTCPSLRDSRTTLEKGAKVNYDG